MQATSGPRARYAASYIDSLLSSDDVLNLATISGIVCASEGFADDAPDFGLPRPVFLLVETLSWLSQAIQAGAWTYFEATPPERQKAMYSALLELAPIGYANSYRVGMEHWTDASRMKRVDAWVDENERSSTKWLYQLASSQRPQIMLMAGCEA